LYHLYHRLCVFMFFAAAQFPFDFIALHLYFGQ
jgi:hypothetical protein